MEFSLSKIGESGRGEGSEKGEIRNSLLSVSSLKFFGCWGVE